MPPTTPTLIFVDTSFWWALRRQRAPNHELVVALLDQYGDQLLLTTNLVRGETWTLINRREGHRRAVGSAPALDGGFGAAGFVGLR